MAPKQKTITQKVSTAHDRAGFSLWFDRNADRVAYALIGLTAFFALLLFNVRLSEGGDDSTYICRALDFLADGRYPSFQGPVYPLFLAFFIKFTGHLSLVVLKFTSLFCLVGGQLVMYLTLRHRVSRRLLVIVLGLMSVNLWFLQFGSLTYSEPFFYLIQWGVVWALLRLADADLSGPKAWQRVALWGGVLALLVVLAGLVRTVGFVWGLVAVVFLLLHKKWVPAGAVVAGCALFFGLWLGVRTAVWGDAAGGASQLQTLLQVDPYDASAGLETPGGYVERFLGNSNLYLSKHYAFMLGLRSPLQEMPNTALTIIFYALFLVGAYRAWKRNRTLLLMALGAAFMLGATFFSTQVLWEQVRLLIPYVAFMHLLVLYGFVAVLREMTKAHAEKIALAALSVMSLVLVSVSAKSVDLPTLRTNLNDNMLAGYTPDWYNYLGLCYAVGQQLNDDSIYVACRKPNMARIYAGGKKFYGIYTIPSADPDELVDNLRQKGVTHCIVASLRRNPKMAGDGVINTMHRYIGTILQKYPRFIEQVCTAGRDENDEPAVLYKLHYEDAVPQQ